MKRNHRKPEIIALLETGPKTTLDLMRLTGWAQYTIRAALQQSVKIGDAVILGRVYAPGGGINVYGVPGAAYEAAERARLASEYQAAKAAAEAATRARKLASERERKQKLRLAAERVRDARRQARAAKERHRGEPAPPPYARGYRWSIGRGGYAYD